MTRDSITLKKTLLTAGIGLAFAAGTSQAATFEVTSNADSGAGSLREAIEGANAGPGPHTLDLAGISGQTIALESSLPAFEDTESEITILGADATLDGANAYTCIASDSTFLQDGNDLIISDLTVQNCIGAPQGDDPVFYFGGGIRVSLGSLALENVTVIGNSADYGGGVWSTGDLTIVDSVITGNEAAINVGGVNGADSLTLIGTEISDNIAVAGNSGGFRCLNVTGGCALTLEQSTVTGNSASEVGGGGLAYAKYESQSPSITASTISGNTADYGGGIYLDLADGETVSIVNSTITANQAETGAGILLFVGGSEVDTTLDVRASTIAVNSATDIGGGILVYNDSDYALAIEASASIIQGNTSGVAGSDLEQFAAGPSGSSSPQSASESWRASAVDRATRLLNELTDSEQAALGLSRDEILARAAARDAEPRGVPSVSANLEATLLGALPQNFTATLDAVSQGVLGSDAMPGPLQNNGGPTPTHVPALGSPAIDLVPVGSAGCGDTLTVDQRGQPRPFGPGCDAGSVEVGAGDVAGESTPVPTMSRIGLAVLALGMGLMGLLGWRRRNADLS